VVAFLVVAFLAFLALLALQVVVVDALKRRVMTAYYNNSILLIQCKIFLKIFNDLHWLKKIKITSSNSNTIYVYDCTIYIGYIYIVFGND
jgi:hypothetical protein